MNYLALVNRLKTECGVSGSPLTTVVGVTGEMARLVAWVAQSLVEIEQENPYWSWMQKAKSFDTTAGKANYIPTSDVLLTTDIYLTDFARWRNHSFRIYLKSAGVNNQVLLGQSDYNSFRDYYLLGARQSASARPVNVAIGPDFSLWFGLTPDAVYTVGTEYYRKPQTLAADADIPLMPEQYHMAIVFNAMIMYALYESAQEVLTRAQQQYSKVMNRLRMDQLPQMMQSGSLM